MMSLNPFDCAILDPLSTKGQKLWVIASKPLSTLYDGDRARLTNFVTAVQTHAHSCKLESAFRIPVGVDAVTGNQVIRDLLTESSLVPLASVIAVRDARESHELAQVNCRAQINSTLLFNFLNGSITGNIQTHIAVKIANGTIQHDGATLYKTILTHISGLANVAAVRGAEDKLRKMHLAAFNRNVKQMHDNVHANLLVLSSNDAVPDDMVHILLTAYKGSTVDEFKQFANRLSDAYNEGEIMEVPNLMHRAETKFDAMKSENKWISSDAKDLKIVALQAKLDLKSNKNNKPAGRKPTGTTGTGTSKSAAALAKVQAEQPWKLQAPAQGEAKSKSFDVTGKGGISKSVLHHWCQVHHNGHGLWCQHKPQDCKLASMLKEQRKGGFKEDGQGGSPPKKPKLIANLAIIPRPSSGYSDSDDGAVTHSE
jgi:hypothetical protein